jgi:hypothetical protein
MPAIETKLSPFEIKLEPVFMHLVQANHPVLGIAPKRLNAVDVLTPAHKLVAAGCVCDQTKEGRPLLTKRNGSSRRHGLDARDLQRDWPG